MFKMNMYQLFYLLLIIFNFNMGVNGYIRACYFTNWAQYREGRAKFLPEDYLPGLCTHILFAFGWMNEDYTAKAYDPADLPNEWAGEGLYKRINALKVKDPNLKTLLSFGGWTFGTNLFQRMSSTSQNRAIFIKSVIEFVRSYGFDGIDIDWEYPFMEDKSQYIKFLKELREAVSSETSINNKLLITAAVAADPEKIDMGYNVPAMSELLDFVMVMTYDFHGSWEQKTGMNAPLFATKKDAENPTSKLAKWNVEGASNYWLQKGLKREKLIVGLSTYGRGWTLSNNLNQNRGIGADGTTAKPTKYVQLSGTVAYFEICEMLANGAERYFDIETQVPYLIYENQWFTYDDVESFKIKANWIRKNQFGGAFVWTLDFDDFNGKCPITTKYGQISPRYPLISTLANILGDGIILENYKTPLPQINNNIYGLIPTTTTTTTTISSYYKIKPTFPSPPLKVAIGMNLDRICYSQRDGFQANPNSCTEFVLCLSSKGYPMKCPIGLEFNNILRYCTYSLNSGCSKISIELTTTKNIIFTTTTTTTSDLFNQKKEFVCTKDGFFADPNSCSHFYRCVGSISYRFDCPPGLKFNQNISQCDIPTSVNCI